MDNDSGSIDAGWSVAGAGRASRGARSAQAQSRQQQHSRSSAGNAAARSGHATPWSGYATPQSGYASPRSGYPSPRVTPQRGRAPPPLSLASHRALATGSGTASPIGRGQHAKVKALALHESLGANTSRASTPGLKPPSTHVPTDIVIEILRHYARISPSCALKALLVSRDVAPALEDAVYANVSLFSASAMNSFNELVKAKPDVGRRVKALWIAPGSLKSDLIASLAPPTSNAANDARQRKVQGMARDILRACRRLDHLAVDGGFLTPQSATAFGTACKPRTLLCVNPHSFLGHFSAPIFRTTVRRLEIVDTTLAVEEVDEIRQMQGLHAFVWTSPRANTDVTRDVSVLLRILSPRASDIAALQNGQGIEGEGLAEILAASGSAAPDRNRQNDKLQSICTATSHARAAALAASFKKVVESITVHDDEDGYTTNEEDEDGIDDIVRAMRAVRADGGVYVDSSMSRSSALHAPSGVQLQTEALSSLMHALATVSKGSRDVEKGKRDKAVKGKMNAPELADDFENNSDVDEAPSEDNSDESDYDDDDDDDDDVVEEWEALRDVICQRRTANSTSSSRFFAGVGSGTPHHHGTASMAGSGLLVRSTASSTRAPSTTASGISTPATAGWASQAVSAAPSRAMSRAASPSLGGTADEIDGGRALQRIWRRWRTQINTGQLERFVC